MSRITQYKAALFLNGIPPKDWQDWTEYQIKVAADGAYLYMQKLGIPMDYIVGDLDSLTKQNINIPIIHIAEQESTDMEKALNFIYAQGYTIVHIYGGSGLEQDHFLGNLHVAYKFFTKLEITFFDDLHSYFFLPKQICIQTQKNQLISLIPFPLAQGITTKGLLYPLNGEDLCLGTRIGTRNRALMDEIEISFQSGSMLIFIGKNIA